MRLLIDRADVAFEVDSVDSVFQHAVRNGAKVIRTPITLKDKFGTARMATIKTYGEVTHTLIEKAGYRGVFLPGFRAEESGPDPLSKWLPKVSLKVIDHCVGNQDWDEMEDVCD